VSNNCVLFRVCWWSLRILSLYWNVDGTFERKALSNFVSENKIPLVVAFNLETAEWIFQNELIRQVSSVFLPCLQLGRWVCVFWWEQGTAGCFDIFCWLQISCFLNNVPFWPTHALCDMPSHTSFCLVCYHPLVRCRFFCWLTLLNMKRYGQPIMKLQRSSEEK